MFQTTIYYCLIFYDARVQMQSSYDYQVQRKALKTNYFLNYQYLHYIILHVLYTISREHIILLRGF